MLVEWQCVLYAGHKAIIEHFSQIETNSKSVNSHKVYFYMFPHQSVRHRESADVCMHQSLNRCQDNPLDWYPLWVYDNDCLLITHLMLQAIMLVARDHHGRHSLFNGEATYQTPKSQRYTVPVISICGDTAL